MKIYYSILFIILVYCSCEKDNNQTTSNYINHPSSHSAQYNLLTNHSWNFDTIVEVGAVSGYSLSPHTINFNTNGILERFPSSSVERKWSLQTNNSIIDVTVPQSTPNNQYWDIRSLTTNSLVVKIRSMNDSANTTNYIVFKYKH